jgi:hypothetical protein
MLLTPQVQEKLVKFKDERLLGSKGEKRQS